MTLVLGSSLTGCGGGGGGGFSVDPAAAASAVAGATTTPAAGTSAPAPAPASSQASTSSAGTARTTSPPPASSVGDYSAKGMNLVRLPFRWERLQPQLNQELDLVGRRPLVGRLHLHDRTARRRRSATDGLADPVPELK